MADNHQMNTSEQAILFHDLLFWDHFKYRESHILNQEKSVGSKNI